MHDDVRFDIDACREQFPALAGGAAFFDGPGETQVRRCVLTAISHYFEKSCAIMGGAFAISRDTDAVLLGERSAMADQFRVSDSGEFVFGGSMTALTFNFTRALGRVLGPGDAVVVTELDHDANFTPWVCLAERGVDVRVVPLHSDTFDIGGFQDLCRSLRCECLYVRVLLAINGDRFYVFPLSHWSAPVKVSHW